VSAVAPRPASTTTTGRGMPWCSRAPGPPARWTQARTSPRPPGGGSFFC